MLRYYGKLIASQLVRSMQKKEGPGVAHTGPSFVR